MIQKIRMAGSVMLVERVRGGIRVVPHTAQHYKILHEKKALLKALREPNLQPLKVDTRGYGEILLSPYDISLHPVEGSNYWWALRMSLGEHDAVFLPLGEHDAVFLLGEVDVQAMKLVLSRRDCTRIEPQYIDDIFKSKRRC